MCVYICVCVILTTTQYTNRQVGVRRGGGLHVARRAGPPQLPHQHPPRPPRRPPLRPSQVRERMRQEGGGESPII
jgi:hypothetical protein